MNNELLVVLFLLFTSTTLQTPLDLDAAMHNKSSLCPYTGCAHCDVSVIR